MGIIGIGTESMVPYTNFTTGETLQNVSITSDTTTGGWECPQCGYVDEEITATNRECCNNCMRVRNLNSINREVRTMQRQLAIALAGLEMIRKNNGRGDVLLDHRHVAKVYIERIKGFE